MKRRAFLKLLAGGAGAAALGLPLVNPIGPPAVPSIPVGTVFAKICDDGVVNVIFDGGAWLPCDGRTVSRARYAKLFEAMGTIYGGSGNTFNLPDFRGRAVR